MGSEDWLQGPCLEIRAARKLLDGSRCLVDSRLVAIDRQGMLLQAFPVQ